MDTPASVSVRDVARHAGVSLGTVSNVLNRPELVLAATLERVQRSIEELGYVRNEAARQLRAGHSRTIGLVVLDIGNPFFTDIAAGVEEAAAEAGLSVVLCNSADDQEREDHYLSLLEQQRSFGILLSPINAITPRLNELHRHGMATVLVDRGSTHRQCSVSVNDEVGGRYAVEHLTAQGHRRIAYVGGPLTLSQVSDRLAGARAALAAAGLPEDRLTVVETTALNVASGRAAASRIAAVGVRRRPTAIFCANDLLALGVLQELTRRRLRVPQDIAIVGYDDIEFASAAAVPLTSIRQPRVQLGKAATQLLIEEVTDPANHRHRQVVFEPELVVRESTVQGGTAEAAARTEALTERPPRPGQRK